MKNEDKMVELLAELVKESHETKVEISGMRGDIIDLQKGQARNTAAVGELRLSVIKLTEKLEMVVDHERRIGKLESTVYK